MTPRDVLDLSYSLLVKGSTIVYRDRGILRDIQRSLLELISGVVLSGLIAIMVSKCLSTFEIYKNFLNSVLPIFHVLPLLVYLIITYWIALSPSFVTSLGSRFFLLQAIIAVILLSFFPFLQTLWGLRAEGYTLKIVLAFDDALPFSFAAVVFAESMNSVQGLGFLMMTSAGRAQTALAVTVSVMMVVLLFLMIWTLRTIAKLSKGKE